MGKRDDIPPELLVRRMKTSDIVQLASGGNSLTLAAFDLMDAIGERAARDWCAAELDARIPPREVKP